MTSLRSLPGRTSNGAARFRVARFTTAFAGALLMLLSGIRLAAADEISAATRAQIDSLLAEKAARTPAERKMDSQLVYFAKQARSQPISSTVTTLQTDVQAGGDNRVLVDVKATVSPELLGFIAQAGGVVINSFASMGAIRASVPAEAFAALAARDDVRFVEPAALATTNLGTVTTEGDRTHRADTARSLFPTNGGAGIKIGVISNGISSLSASIANGNLNANATFIPGQAGSGDEGTAMMEIIQDIVPNAQLIFATGNGGPANMANNILLLRDAGCSIIVDDLSYSNETPFQDQVISQAVTTVSTSGVMYFSSAANSGSKDKGTSGTWEGDFADGGAATGGLAGKGGSLHDFGGGVTANIVTAPSSSLVNLFWADPLGASSNDYDLFIVDASGNVLRSSTNVQSGTQDPIETVSSVATGERIVVVKAPTAAARFIHIDTARGRITVNTAGNVRGHNASGATNAFSVAAIATNNAPSPGFFTGGAGNPAEYFSSDGPRRIFFTPSGVALTPGNFSSTGGQVLNKPDFTAADGVSTSVTGFTSFYGTSAAAPHAAAIAALLKSYNSQLTPAQIRTLLTSTALDIEAPGYDRVAGAGVIMALAAIQAAPAPDPLSVALTSSNAGTSGTAGGPFSPSTVVYTLTNSSAAPIAWTVTKTQPWTSLSPAGGATLAAGTSTTLTITFNATLLAALPVGSYADTLSVTNSTTGFAQNFTVPVTVSTQTPVLLYDSSTNATITSTSSTPHTFMGMAMSLGTAGGTTNITVGGGSTYLVPAISASYANVRLNITLWGTASNAISGTTPAFSNNLGTFSYDLGPQNLTAFLPVFYRFTLPAGVTMPTQAGGVTFNWQGDTGAGLVSTDNLAPAIRYGSAPAVGALTAGTAGTNGYYRNVSSEQDGNFFGSSFRSLGGTPVPTYQGLALQLYPFPCAPMAVTGASSNISSSGATVSGTVNTAGSPSTGVFEYGPTTSYGASSGITLSPANGTSAQTVTATLTGLTPGTLYHYRVTVANGYGTSSGRDFTFTTGANVAPVVKTTGGPVFFVENQAPVVIDSGLTVSDADSVNLTGATVAMTGGSFAGSEDALGFVNQGGISGNYNPATGILTLSGTAAVATYQAALRTVTYVNTSENPTVDPGRLIQFTVNDGQLTGFGNRLIAITSVNDAPTMDPIADRAPIPANSPMQTVNLTGISAGGEPQSVAISIIGNTNPGLIPSAQINFTGNTTGTLTYTPAANRAGVTTLTLQVSDDGGTANGGVDRITRSFRVTVSPTVAHSADLAPADGAISLAELTRVIELYNTHFGSQRTGRYMVSAGGVDGFAVDTSGAGAVTLTKYHSADSNQDGRISLVELTRVIEFYFYKNGAVRTGEYHAQSGAESGFAPGP